jgi:Fe-S cluster assembly protein SufD
MSASASNLLPTNRDENWRYANLRALAKARPEAVLASPVISHDSLPPAIPGYARWVFVDGHFAPSLSRPRPEAGVAVLDHDTAGATAAALDADLASEGIDFALARANAARGKQVLHVALREGATAAVEVVFVAASTASAGIAYPRMQLHAGRNSSLKLVERHVSVGARDSIVNAAVDVALNAGATVDHTRVQNCADGASVFDTLIARVGENANYRFRSVTLGGAAARSTAFIRLAGRAARCEFIAASIANGLQTLDAFAEIEHAAPETATREVFRGIATDRGKLAFNGKMIVRENAFDADSDQSLKTLLTGSGAEAAARPQLEIYTDRVKAKHGATTGKLDEQMLFYLLSRGIDRTTAQSLLQWAFVEDAVSKIEPAELRREVEQLVSAQLLEVSALGLVGERS